MLQINLILPMQLTYALLPQLRRATKGYVLNVASTAAYQAVPSLTVYAASKAFMLSFSWGLRYELKGSPISVTCLSPGATATDFGRRAGMGAELQAVASKVAMTASQVAETGLEALFAGKAGAIPGMLNKVSAGLMSIVPKSLVEKTAAGIYEK